MTCYVSSGTLNPTHSLTHCDLLLISSMLFTDVVHRTFSACVILVGKTGKIY